jgi:hypothetical protein
MLILWHFPLIFLCWHFTWIEICWQIARAIDFDQTCGESTATCIARGVCEEVNCLGTKCLGYSCEDLIRSSPCMSKSVSTETIFQLRCGNTSSSFIIQINGSVQITRYFFPVFSFVEKMPAILGKLWSISDHAMLLESFLYLRAGKPTRINFTFNKLHWRHACQY